MSQPRPGRTEERRKNRVNPRNVPLHILFWAFALFLLYLFIKALAR